MLPYQSVVLGEHRGNVYIKNISSRYFCSPRLVSIAFVHISPKQLINATRSHHVDFINSLEISPN